VEAEYVEESTDFGKTEALFLGGGAGKDQIDLKGLKKLR